MSRRKLVIALCILMAAVSWQSALALAKATPEIFGYRICDHSKPSEMEAIEKRFGKTYMSEQFAHSSSPIYRTSDNTAYLVFGWSDCGMETIMVAKVLPKGSMIPKSAPIRRIKIASSQVKASCGVALGDTQSHVRKLAGTPTYSNRKGNETNWQYVDRWYLPQDGKRCPMTLLEITFIKGRAVRLWARCEEI